MVTTGGPDAGRGWGWPKASRRSAVLSCPVRGRTCRPRGWPWPAGQRHGRTLGAGGVPAWPPPSGPDVDPSAGRSPRTRDVRPTGRSRRPPCPSPGQRLPGVRRGTDRRRWCPDGCPAVAPWRKWAASLTAGVSGAPRRGPGGGHRAVQGWMRGPTSGSDAESCYATDRVDGRVWRRVGSVGIGKQLPSVGAGGTVGALLGGG